MLKQLADTVEQLDLAAEHIAKADPNNARFGLMLTDNALEIVLHNIARYDAEELKHHSYGRYRGSANPEALTTAQGQNFAPKIRYGELINLYDGKTAETLTICHGFRNELYHAGIQHEAILPYLARFHFHTVCSVLGGHKPEWFSWSSTSSLPERSRKYFAGPDYFPGTPEQYESACSLLKASVHHDDQAFIETLAHHMESVVDDQDANIDFIATDAPKSLTRDEVVRSSQSWPLVGSNEVQSAMAAVGFTPRNLFEAVDWVEANFKLRTPKDPVPGWRRRVSTVRRQTNCHDALKGYRSFMDQTRQLREWINQDAAALDREIQGQIDRMRGK